MRTIPSFQAAVGAIMAIGVACATTAPALAASIDPREIALVMESTLVDIDTMMIDLHLGRKVGESLTYRSKIERDGWNGRLWGTHGSNEIDILYSGFFTPIGDDRSSFQITYTSDWLVNGISGAGGGVGIFTDPELEFGIVFDEMAVGGAIAVNYGVASLRVEGRKDLEKHELTAQATIGVITAPILNVSLADASAGFKYFQLTGDYNSFTKASILFGLIETGTRIVNEGNVITKTTRPVPPPPTRDDDDDYPYLSQEEIDAGMAGPDGCQGYWCDPPLTTNVLPAFNVGLTRVAPVPAPPSAWMLCAAVAGLLSVRARARADLRA